MKILLVSAVIIVAAVAGGLILGGFVSEGFFTGFMAAQGSPQNATGDQAAADGSGSSSPGFKIKMGSKSGGNSDSNDGDAAADDVDAPGNTSSTGNTTTVAFTFSGSSKKKSGGGSKPSPESEPPVNNNRVYVTPPSSSVGVNGTFTVSVDIDSDVRVYAATIKLSYDSSVIKAVSADQGNFFTKDGAENYKIIKIDNVTGTVSYDNTRFQVAEGVQGTGSILTVVFVAQATGTSSLSISEAQILGDDISNIDVRKEGGAVNVQ